MHLNLAVLLLTAIVANAAEMITLQPGADDGAAITQALARLGQAGGGTLTLAPGRYRLRATVRPEAAVLAGQLSGITIVGQDAVLVGSGATRLFGFDACRGLTLRNLRITCEPLPHTVGTVVAQDAAFHGVELAVAAPYRAEAGRLTQAVMGWDLANARTSSDGWETYQCNGERPEPSTVTAAGHLRVPIQRGAKLPAIGGTVVVRHEVYAGGAILMRGCSDVLIEDVAVEATSGMGLMAWECRDLTVRRFSVVPPPGFAMSATADAMHFGACRGRILVEDSTFAGMGDDAINIHGMYGLVVERPDDRTLLVQRARLHPYYDKERSTWDLPAAGDAIEACAADAPLLPVADLTVAESRQDGKRTLIRSTQPLPAAITVGSLLANTSTLPSARIARCKVRGNRARGFLLQTRDVVVEDCAFTDVSGAAIQICADAAEWCEGPGVRDVIIRRCSISGCNYGIARRAAAIDVFADLAGNRPAPPGVHRGIRIEDCMFTGPGTAVHIGSTDGVVVGPNRYQKDTAVDIAVDHSRGVEIVHPPGKPPQVRLGEGCSSEAVHLKPR
ncbi:MAG: hypothetical protein WCJ14_02090 [Verrucomicrobiota bacterium]